MKSALAIFFRRLDRGFGLFAVIVLWSSPASAALTGDAKSGTNAFAFVDLSPFAPAAGRESSTAPIMAELPSGLQIFHGVPFLIRERVFVTGLESARIGEFFPTELTGIPVNRKARRLHLLHGALGVEKDGVPMAKLVFHYASGATDSVRVGYGVQARNWIALRTEKKSELADPNSSVAWANGDQSDRAPDYRLFQTAVEIPRSGELVTSLDIVSLFSRATPFIAGLSVEDETSKLSVNKPLPLRKVVRELNEFEEPVYRQELMVSITDAEGGAPLTNAVAMLSVTDDQQPFTFGEARADARGVCRLPYPPQQTLTFHLLVRAPNRVPQILSETRTNRAGFSREFTVALSRGVTVGGLVKARDSNVIAGAKVAVYRVTKTGAREYTRTDHDLAITGADGKWTSSSLPAGFEGFSFEVSHPDFRTALYAMPGQVAGPSGAAAKPGLSRGPVFTPEAVDSVKIGLQPLPAEVRGRRPGTRPVGGPSAIQTVTSNALLATTADMTLQPAILVSGVLLDSDGKPLADAPILFQRHNPSYERKQLKTDADGRFRVMAQEPGDGALMVVRNGQTPKFQPLNIVPGMGPMEIKLAPARTLRGRVLDRQKQPVQGATVRLDDWMGATDLLRFQALTDEEGRFTWNGAPTDQVMLYVTKSNHYTMRHSMSGQNNELTLYLNRPPGVSGKVYDAETKEPIDLFTIIKGRKYSSSDPIIRWERGDTARGHHGEYSIRVDEYYFQPEARIMIEAPGYIPQISRGFPSSDSYTSDFALKKGRGIRALVKTAEGTPAANATVVLVDRNESGYMDMAGQFRSGGSSGDFARSDANGQFEFSPKLEADWILVSHERGFAEMKADQVESTGTIVLQSWGRVKGVMRVGDKPEPDQTVRLQNRYDRYYEPGHRSTALALYLKAEPDETGQFVFEKVPPGERRLYVEYRFKERQSGETPLSHGLPVSVNPGETTDITLGGSGRKVVGRVQVIGGDQSDVDWRRDVHRLTLVLPAGDAPQAPDVSKLAPEDRQKAWEQFNQRQREFWQTEAGLARERAERTYILVFETNGQFRVDHVPPGKYLLSIVANDPDEEYYRQRNIGSLTREIEVPNVAGAKVNEPFDVGTLELTIRGKLRIGKAVAPLETKSLEGSPIKLADYRGKHVLLFFWSSDAGTGSYDLQVLKEMHNTFGRQDKLVVLGLNLDADAQAAAQFVKNNGMLWPQAHLGEWSQTQVPAAFGVDGIPTGVLIDGEARLVARNLRGSSIRTAIRNAMASQPAPN